MKLVTVKESKLNSFLRGITKIEQYVIFIYLFCMLGIFPLYYREQYYKIGDAKFQFFWNISLWFVGFGFFFLLLKKVLESLPGHKDMSGRKSGKAVAEIERNKSWTVGIFLEHFLENLSMPDYAVLIYGVCVCLSYGFSEYKEYAFKGAAGWEMGFCSQMIFVGTYFLLSAAKQGSFRKTKNRKAGLELSAAILLGVHLMTSAATFLFGILHRFDVDPLGMYVGLELYHKIEFLSTIGQATWFSGYVCAVFPVGLVLFYVSKKTWIRVVSGIYTVISFGILVTQNSDSAFIAIAGILLLLGYFSLRNIDDWCRFLQMACLMWGTFVGIGVLQRVFSERTIPLDALSTYASQSLGTKCMLICSLGLWLFYQRYSSNPFLSQGVTKQEKKSYDTVKIMKITKKIYQGMLIVFAAAVMVTIVFIYLNTKGYLLQWFGYQSTHPYLLFDYHWGSNRGSTWIICWQAFREMPFYQKLFGVGPDSLSQYLYSVPDRADLLYSLWGNLRLTNAHNEYLNCLLNMGMVGLVSWLGVLIGGIRYFYVKAKENKYMIAFALCIMGYACHNIFCYQQVCATPFLFIILGVGECLTKSENFNTIK